MEHIDEALLNYKKGVMAFSFIWRGCAKYGDSGALSFHTITDACYAVDQRWGTVFTI